MNRPRFYSFAVFASLAAVVFISSWFCFWNLDASSLGARDESLHVSATQSMLHEGRWLIPRVNGAPYFGKPPFKMWVSTLPVSLLGESTFAFRSTDATLGVLTCAVLFLFTFSATQSVIAGMIAALALLGCSGYVLGHGPRVAVQDAMLVFLFTSAMYFGARALGIVGAHSHRVRSAILGGVVLGCALLTKSAAGAVPIVVLSTTWVLICFRERRLVSGIRELILLTLVAFATAAPYYYFQYVAPRGGFSALVGYGVVARALDGFHNVDKPFFYFTRIFIDRAAIPPELLLMVLALCSFLFLRQRSAVAALVLMWILVPLTGFSLAQSRLTWYIAPSFIGMGVGVGLLAQSMMQWWKLPSHPRWKLFVGCLAFCSVALLSDSLLRVARNVLDASSGQRIEMQDAVETMRAHLNKGGNVTILHRAAFTFREEPYLAMLTPWIVKKGSEDVPLLPVSPNEFPSFVIIPIEKIGRIERFEPPQAYKLLGPLEQRERAAVVAGYGMRDIPHGFHPMKLYLTPSDLTSMAMYGGGELGTFNGVPVTVLRGPRSAFALSADGLHERFGVTLSFRVAPRGGTGKVPLSVFLNDKKHSSIELKQSGFSDVTIEIPPHVLQVGKNFLGLSFGAEGQGDPRRSERVETAMITKLIMEVRWPVLPTQE